MKQTYWHCDMQEYQDRVKSLIDSIMSLEYQIDKQLELDKNKTDELKKVYKDNQKLKKQYQILSQQVEDCIQELQSIKKLYGKN